MARIVYTLGELKGSVGGLTFQQNSSGKIVRQRPQVSKTSTIKQQQAHQNHISLLKTYQALSNADKDLWNTFASTYTKVNKFGEDKQLTGQNWYESLNWQLLHRSLSLFDVPPTHTLPAACPSFTIGMTADSISVHVADDYPFTDIELNIWTTIPTTRQKVTVNQIRKFVTSMTGESDNPLDITTAWENATGLLWTPTTLFPSSNIFICLQSVSTVSYITSALLCDKKNTNTI